MLLFLRPFKEFLWSFIRVLEYYLLSYINHASRRDLKFKVLLLFNCSFNVDKFLFTLQFQKKILEIKEKKNFAKQKKTFSGERRCEDLLFSFCL